MIERDLVLMTLVIFVPSFFGLFLCVRFIFPRGSDEWMRWWALLGTAVTLVLSLFMFIDYYHMADRMDQTGRPGHSREVLLGARHDRAQADAYPDAPDKGRNAVGIKPKRDSEDWIGRVPWIERFNIDYYLGTDGISMPLVLLTTVLSFLAMLASFNIEKYVRGYCILFLLLETGMVGTFLALDFFLFYIFWELMLLPMYFLIGVWGGPRREYAAIKFFLYTLLGSVFILIAMLGFYFTDVRDFVDPGKARAVVAEVVRNSPRISEEAAIKDARVNSFDLLVLQKAGEAAARLLNGEDVRKVAEQVLINAERARLSPEERRKLEQGSAEALELALRKRVAPNLDAAVERLQQPFFTPTFQYIMFVLLFIGFAIKVPVFPFHTWLPDAHVEAPTPISMILAGVLLKMGGYGILRIAYPICPWAAEMLAWWVCLFGIINIVYGAFAAMAQTDFKKLVAYSSISHMGYVILGIAVWSSSSTSQYWSWAMNGAMFQMIAHGITSAGMFFLVGVIYDRAHHRDLNRFRGLYEPMPLYGGISAVIFFAAMGLPGMCGFVGEFMVVLGTWNFRPPSMPYSGIVFSILAGLTVILTAAYILWTLQRVYLGTNEAYKDYPEISMRELFCVVPLVVLSVLLGVFPTLLLNWMEPSVTGLVNTLSRMPGW